MVANGTLVSRDRFEADEVLAKHDETYMPPEVQDALEKPDTRVTPGKPTRTPGTAAATAASTAISKAGGPLALLVVAEGAPGPARK